MLEEKDLQAIQAVVDESRRLTVEEAVRAAGVMMESYFDPKFELLAESIKDIQDKLVPRSRVDDLEDEVKFLKLMVRQMAERVSTLEKAQ